MTRPSVLLLVLAAARGSAAQAFEDRTFLAGLGATAGANGVAVADCDGDGTFT